MKTPVRTILTTFLSLVIAQSCAAQVLEDQRVDTTICGKGVACQAFLQIVVEGHRTILKAGFAVPFALGHYPNPALVAIYTPDTTTIDTIANTLLHAAGDAIAANGCPPLVDNQFRDALLSAISLVERKCLHAVHQKKCEQCVTVVRCGPPLVGVPFFGSLTPTPSPTPKLKGALKPKPKTNFPLCSGHNSCYRSYDPKCCLEKCLCGSKKHSKKSKKLIKCLSKCVKGKKGSGLCHERGHLCAHPTYNTYQKQGCCVAGCGCHTHISKKAIKNCIVTCVSH